MTGLEHYHAAEALLTEASVEPPGSDFERYAIAAAQAHATLALVAVTAGEGSQS